MILRVPKLEEFSKLIELHKQLEHEFPFPNLRHISSLYVAVQDDEIIGFGILQPIYESILVLDQTKSINARLTALEMLEERAEHEIKNINATQNHVFVQDIKFKNLLKNRFGFEEVKGTALVKAIK